MNDNASGLVLSGRAADLRPLFDRRLRLYERTNTVFPQTRDLWYIEPTLTAMLVASAWGLDIPSITEVKSKRVRAGGTTNGHVDVIVQLDDGPTAVESKIHWFNDMGGFEAVLGRLEDAEADARTIDPTLVRRGLALCFGVLEKGGTNLDQLLRSAIDKAESARLDVLAWTVNSLPPDSVRFPGCMVLGRVV